jgi:hypothetical protein
MHGKGSKENSKPQDKFMMRKKQPRQSKCPKCKQFDSVYRISRNRHVCEEPKTLLNNPEEKQDDEEMEDNKSEEENDAEEVNPSLDEEESGRDGAEERSKEMEDNRSEEEDDAEEVNPSSEESSNGRDGAEERKEKERKEKESQENNPQENEKQGNELFSYVFDLTPEERAQVEVNMEEISLEDYVNWDPNATLVYDNPTEVQTYLLQTPTVKIFLNALLLLNLLLFCCFFYKNVQLERSIV